MHWAFRFLLLVRCQERGRGAQKTYQKVVRNTLHEGGLRVLAVCSGARSVEGVLQNTMHGAGVHIWVVGSGPKKRGRGAAEHNAWGVPSDLGYWFAAKNVGGVLQNTMPGADRQICVVGSEPETWKGCSFCAAATGLPRGRG